MSCVVQATWYICLVTESEKVMRRMKSFLYQETQQTIWPYIPCQLPWTVSCLACTNNGFWILLYGLSIVWKSLKKNVNLIVHFPLFFTVLQKDDSSFTLPSLHLCMNKCSELLIIITEIPKSSEEMLALYIPAMDRLKRYSLAMLRQSFSLKNLFWSPNTWLVVSWGLIQNTCLCHHIPTGHSEGLWTPSECPVGHT